MWWVVILHPSYLFVPNVNYNLVHINLCLALCHIVSVNHVSVFLVACQAPSESALRVLNGYACVQAICCTIIQIQWHISIPPFTLGQPSQRLPHGLPGVCSSSTSPATSSSGQAASFDCSWHCMCHFGNPQSIFSLPVNKKLFRYSVIPYSTFYSIPSTHGINKILSYRCCQLLLTGLLHTEYWI